MSNVTVLVVLVGQVTQVGFLSCVARLQCDSPSGIGIGWPSGILKLTILCCQASMLLSLLTVRLARARLIQWEQHTGNS